MRHLLRAGLVLTVCCGVGRTLVHADQTDAARGVLTRLIGKRAAELRFELIEKDHGRDVFEIAAIDGRVTVRGSSGVAMCRGAYEYLKRTCDAHVSWDGDLSTIFRVGFVQRERSAKTRSRPTTMNATPADW